jgi:hypothetical protein
MAANSLTNVVPQLLAQGLLALRQNVVMPALVNRSYEREAAERGDTVDVPIPSAITAQVVSPSNTPPSTEGVAPTKAQISLDQWIEAPFYLTDKEQLEVMSGTIPMQASEAIKAVANNVDNYILGLYAGVYGYAGTAGTTPFASDTTAATEARKVLNTQLAPLDDRRLVFDPEAEANALNLRAFQDMSFSGSAAAIVEGEINRKLGFDWFMDQNTPTHTAGTASGATTDNSGYAVGVKTVTLASAGTGTILVGDVITFAGDTQTYVVTAGDSDVSDGGTISFEPGLQVAIETSAHAITLKASHTVNLAFHRDAFAFASRPLMGTTQGLGGVVQSAVDPVSGLTLRLEVTREHKRTRWSYDILYGAKLVRRDLAVRLAG